MSAIFISHSSKDNTIAGEIRQWLADQGHKGIFLDFDPADGIPPGRDWEQELYQEIRGCRAVVVLCSEHSMKSRWCFVEITHARALGKHLFPVKISDCRLDGVLTDRQVIDLTRNRDEELACLGRGLREAGLDPADAFDWDNTRPPYPGLLAFQEEDAAIFFGRDDEIGDGLDLLNKVRRLGRTKLVMVLGASGTGKSSLVRAGLLPRLRKDVERWLVVDTFRPREDPAGALATVLSKGLGGGRRRILARLRKAMEGIEVVAEWPGIGEAAEPAPAAAAAVAETEAAAETGSAAVDGATETPKDDEDPAARFLDKLADLEATLPEEAGARAARYLHQLRAAITEQAGRTPSPERGGDAAGGAENPIVDEAVKLKRRVGREEARVLLVIDQFEELLGHEADDVHHRFLQLLRDAIDRPGSPIVVLGTMRSDFLGAFQKSPALLDVRHESLSLGPFSTGDITQVIVNPAKKAGIYLEPELVQELVRDAESENAIPLLAFTLRELNEKYGRKNKKKLTLDAYRDLGGLQKAVAQAADDIFEAEEVSREDKGLLRAAFRSLVRVTEDRTFARRTAHRADLPPEALPLIDRFVDGRLLVTGKDEQGPTLEVAHESLFRSWDTLVRWLEQDYEALLLRQEIERAARNWHEDGRHAEPLWAGVRLGRARQLLARDADLHPNALGLEFVEAAEEADRAHIREEKAEEEAKEAARRRELKKTRRFLAAVSVVAVIAVGLGLFAWRESRRARRQTLQTRQALLLSATRELAEDPTFQASLLREMGTEDPMSVRGFQELAEATVHKPVATVVLEGHERAVTSAAFSSDGRILTASEDGTARVWDADGSGEHVRLEGFQPGVTVRWNLPRGAGEVSVTERYEGGVTSAAFSTDGNRVVTLGDDITVRVWNADGSGEPVILRDKEFPWGYVTGAAFSPDGQLVVTPTDNAGAHVWRADGTGDPFVFEHDYVIYSAAFSPDSKQIVTASEDGTAQVWSVDGTGETIVLDPREAFVYSAEFSPDGKRVVTVSDDSSARVWQADGSEDPVILAGHEDAVLSATFSVDNGRVATASRDGTARVWNADGSGDAVVLEGHDDAVRSAAFSPDGRLVVTTSDDGTARVWNADGTGAASVLEASRVLSAAFSPDSRRVVTASADGTARLWEVGQAYEPVVFDWPEEEILRGNARPGAPGWRRSISFGPAGGLIATATRDHTVRVRNIDRSGKPVVLPGPGHEAEIWSADFSPDGQRVVTASEDGTARVWMVDGSGEPVVLHGHEDEVLSATFSPDGQRVVTAAEDKTARVWNADGSGQAIVLENPEKAKDHQVWSAAFSPDGQRVLTAVGENRRSVTRWGGSRSEEVWDETVQLWNADGKGEPIVMQGYGPRFGPNGRIATVFLDRRYLASEPVVRVWNSDGSGEPVVLKGHNAVSSIAFSPDGARIVTASEDRTARVWNADGSGKPVVLEGHGKAVRSAAFSPDGQRVVTTSSDGTVRIWNADGSGEPFLLEQHDGNVRTAVFTPDGRRIVTVFWDDVVRVWDADYRSRLWKKASACLSAGKRKELLGRDADDAERDVQRCRRMLGCLRESGDGAFDDCYREFRRSQVAED